VNGPTGLKARERFSTVSSASLRGLGIPKTFVQIFLKGRSVSFAIRERAISAMVRRGGA